jgi:tyrosyl-tRNA synthetase
MNGTSTHEQLEIIKQGAVEIISETELLRKLEESQRTGKPLRIKYGIDPTGFDVHLGHMVPICKIRTFQNLGHQAVIIIGDYTAQIGDPTGKNETRPSLTKEQVHKNAEKYMEQMYKVLDPAKTEVRYQTEWFGNFQLADILKLASHLTLHQVMTHETFRVRFEQKLPLALHELMYPLLQAYDSVMVKADVEMGGTDQKFNILQGRDLQREYNQPQQVAVFMPLLMGTNGEKMGKSLNNYIAVLDTPADKFGKVMSIKDELIPVYAELAAFVKAADVAALRRQLADSATNPRNLKSNLARQIVALYHGAEAADQAQAGFDRVFKNKELPVDLPVVKLTSPEPAIWIVKLLREAKLVESGGEARRLIVQGGITVNGTKITDENATVVLDGDLVVKAGKLKICRVVPAKN